MRVNWERQKTCSHGDAHPVSEPTREELQDQIVTVAHLQCFQCGKLFGREIAFERRMVA